MADPRTEPSPQQTNAFTVVLRITWMMAGPVACGLLVFFIFAEAQGVSWHDAAVGLSLLGTIAVRYIDVAFFRGETGDGRVATMTDFWRYAIKLSLVIGAGWALAHGLRLL